MTLQKLKSKTVSVRPGWAVVPPQSAFQSKNSKVKSKIFLSELALWGVLQTAHEAPKKPSCFPFVIVEFLACRFKWVATGKNPRNDGKIVWMPKLESHKSL